MQKLPADRFATVAAFAEALAIQTSRAPDMTNVNRFDLALGANETLAATGGVQLAWSADGRSFAYSGTAPTGTAELFVRSLDSLVATPLAGTDGASLLDCRIQAGVRTRRLRRVGGWPAFRDAAPRDRGERELSSIARHIGGAFPQLTPAALRIKAASTERSLSDLVNAAIRASLAEDAEDLAAFDARAKEPSLAFEDAPKDLKRRGKL